MLNIFSLKFAIPLHFLSLPSAFNHAPHLREFSAPFSHRRRKFFFNEKLSNVLWAFKFLISQFPVRDPSRGIDFLGVRAPTRQRRHRNFANKSRSFIR